MLLTIFPSKRSSKISFQVSVPVRDTPLYRAMPFRDSVAEGGIAGVCLVFIGYRASIAEIPLLCRGVSHLHFACSVRGKCSEKGEGVSHPIGDVATPKTPQRTIGGSVSRNTGPLRRRVWGPLDFLTREAILPGNAAFPGH